MGRADRSGELALERGDLGALRDPAREDRARRGVDLRLIERRAGDRDQSLERHDHIAECGLRIADFAITVRALNRRNRPSPVICRRYWSITPTVPSPYFTLRQKLIDDASAKYRVGIGTSPILKP